MIRRWFFLAVVGMMAAGIVYGATSTRRFLTPLPETSGPEYNKVKEVGILRYIRDTSAVLQRDHQAVMEALDELKSQIKALNGEIESLQNKLENR